MRYPPRLAHLATRPVLLARLGPTYAQAHQIDDEEARERLDLALKGPLIDDLLAETWSALLGGTKRLTPDGLLEKIAKSLQERPLRPGRVAALNPAWSAFLLVVDLAANTASEAARKVMETDAGRAKAREGLGEAGKFLAAELTR